MKGERIALEETKLFDSQEMQERAMRELVMINSIGNSRIVHRCF